MKAFKFSLITSVLISTADSESSSIPFARQITGLD